MTGHASWTWRDRKNGGSRARGAALIVLLLGGVLAATTCAFWDETAPAPSGTRPDGRLRDRPDDEDAAALVPAGMETVIDVNMALIRQSPWVAPAVDARDPRRRSAKEDALGYDDINDLDRLIYAVTEAGADAPTLVIAQGRLQQSRVEEAFRNRWPQAVVDRWRGISVIARGENAIAFLTARTFAAGTPPSVHAVIDRAFGIGPDVSADVALGPTRRALCPEGDAAKPALLATIAVDQRLRGRVGDAAPLPRELRQIGVRLDLGQSVELSLLGILDDREAAAALARRLRTMIDDPATRLALRAVGLGNLPAETRVATDGARVIVHASIAEDNRAALSAMLRTLVESTRDGTGAGGFGSW